MCLTCQVGRQVPSERAAGGVMRVPEPQPSAQPRPPRLAQPCLLPLSPFLVLSFGPSPKDGISNSDTWPCLVLQFVTSCPGPRSWDSPPVSSLLSPSAVSRCRMIRYTTAGVGPAPPGVVCWGPPTRQGAHGVASSIGVAVWRPWCPCASLFHDSLGKEYLWSISHMLVPPWFQV